MNHLVIVLVVFLSVISQCRFSVQLRPSLSSSRHSSTICLAVSTPVLHWHLANSTLGTPIRHKKGIRPIHPVQICIRTELSAFYSLLCSCSTATNGSQSSQSICLAHQLALYCVCQSQSTACYIGEPALCQMSSSVCPSSSHLIAQQLLAWPRVGLSSRLYHSHSLPLIALQAVSITQSCPKLASLQQWPATSPLRYKSRGGTNVLILRFRVSVALYAPEMIQRHLFQTI